MYTAMAYPGSPLYYQAKKNGWELPETYVGYSQHAYETLNLSNENWNIEYTETSYLSENHNLNKFSSIF